MESTASQPFKERLSGYWGEMYFAGLTKILPELSG